MKMHKGLMSIGDFAAYSGSTRQAMQYYDHIGLLDPIAVGNQGYRYYHPLQGHEVRLIHSLQECGCSLEETADWVRAHAMHIHHQFYSTELDFYRHSGRMSGTQAALATVLNICPIMRLDRTGHIKAYGKVRGRKAAIRTTLNEMEAHCEDGKDYSGKCYICHSECLEAAEETKRAVQERFPKISGDIRICDIGTIIASHCGWGTVAVFFLGDERPEME